MSTRRGLTWTLILFLNSITRASDCFDLFEPTGPVVSLTASSAFQFNPFSYPDSDCQESSWGNWVLTPASATGEPYPDRLEDTLKRSPRGIARSDRLVKQARARQPVRPTRLVESNQGAVSVTRTHLRSELTWPTALERPKYALVRRDLEALLVSSDEDQTESHTDRDRRMVASVQRLKDLLRAEIRSLHTAEYLDAMRHLDQLERATRR